MYMELEDLSNFDRYKNKKGNFRIGLWEITKNQFFDSKIV